MKDTPHTDNRLFNTANGIGVNLLVVLIGCILLSLSTVSSAVGLLVISAGTVGVVIVSASARGNQSCWTNAL